MNKSLECHTNYTINYHGNLTLCIAKNLKKTSLQKKNNGLIRNENDYECCLIKKNTVFIPFFNFKSYNFEPGHE